MALIALNWETAHLYGEAWISHHRLRHRLFIDRQNWAVPSFGGLEFDQFDNPAAHYLLWLDPAGQARGAVRLVPTTQPYMLQTLWPDLLGDDVPQDPRIWEASRFGCDRDLPAGLRWRVLSELIHGCQEFGLARGIQAYLALMPRWVFEHVLAARGCTIRYAKARPARRQSIAAAHIPVAPAILARIGQRCGITAALLPDRTGAAAGRGRRRDPPMPTAMARAHPGRMAPADTCST